MPLSLFGFMFGLVLCCLDLGLVLLSAFWICVWFGPSLFAYSLCVFGPSLYVFLSLRVLFLFSSMFEEKMTLGGVI